LTSSRRCNTSGLFTNWFAGFEGPIRQDIDHLTIVGDADVAVTSMLIRSGGTLPNGHEVDRWVRATSGCQRSDHGWLITHEHISVPVDLGKGIVVADLEP
jgi:ketosteroid isomerase-like protein